MCSHSNAIYQITVEGNLDQSWAHWFDDLSITTSQREAGEVVTLLAGPIADQPALRGILNKLWDLNLILISVTRLEKETLSPKEANHVTPLHSLTS